MSKPKHVSKVRQRTKTALVEAFGHRCDLCGLEDHEIIYDFHHIDPSIKDFGLSNGNTRSKEATVIEAKKCVMLCSHCHRKVENNIIEKVDFISNFDEEKFYSVYQSLLDYPNNSH